MAKTASNPCSSTTSFCTATATASRTDKSSDSPPPVAYKCCTMSLYDFTGHPSSSASPHDCTDCVAEYSTSSMDMTSQCTDQCVVITCNDPAHADASNCTGTVGLRLDCCDVWCQEPTEACKNCNQSGDDVRLSSIFATLLH